MNGFLDRAREWMTPERSIAMQGLGMAFSQLGAGQPVNLSPAYEALNRQKEAAKLRKVMETPGIMDSFTPQQRAILAQMPEELAVRVLTESAFRPPEAPRAGIEVGNRIVDPVTGQVIYEAPAQVDPGFRLTTPEEEAIYGAKGQVGPDGRFYPLQQGPDTVVNVGGEGGPTPQIGTIPQGYVAVPDPTNPAGYTMRPIPGGPEDTSKKDAMTAAARDTATDTVINAATRAREAAGNRQLGPLGTRFVAWANGMSDSAEVYRQVDTLKAMATAENLAAMRAASPTGGALGAVSDADLKLLAAKTGALDPESPNFERDLADYELTILKTIHGPEAGQAIFDQSRNGTTTPTPAPTGAAPTHRYNPATGKIEPIGGQ